METLCETNLSLLPLRAARTRSSAEEASEIILIPRLFSSRDEGDSYNDNKAEKACKHGKNSIPNAAAADFQNYRSKPSPKDCANYELACIIHDYSLSARSFLPCPLAHANLPIDLHLITV